jgi:hypothetical protein
MLVHKICKQYSHLLELGKTYTGREFAAMIQKANKKYIEHLENTKTLFERTENGISLNSQ